MYQSKQAFTLVELLVTLLVVGVVATLALPAFNGLFERSRATTEVNDLAKALQYARLEAVNRAASISVKPLDNTNWNKGIQVLVGNTKLHEFPSMSASSSLSEKNGVTTVEFNSVGALSQPTSAAEFNYANGNSSSQLLVCVTGRVVVGGGCS